YDPAATAVNDPSDCRFFDEQFLMHGWVTSFELESASGTKIGLNPSIGLFGLGLGFNYASRKARMSLTLTSTDAYLERVLAASYVSQTQTERNINFDVSYQMLAGLGYQS